MHFNAGMPKRDSMWVPPYAIHNSHGLKYFCVCSLFFLLLFLSPPSRSFNYTVAIKSNNKRQRNEICINSFSFNRGDRGSLPVLGNWISAFKEGNNDTGKKLILIEHVRAGT